MPFDVEKLKSFPDKPGVYLMKGKGGQVLYVGKAKNLRQRVRQYFIRGGDGRFMVPFLIAKVEDVETVIVLSEKEALILENNLIKQYKPKYNALLKDDKNYIALKVTRHQWPRIDLIRYRGKPKADGLYFGPYTHAGSARKTLDLLHKIFPLRQCSDKEFSRRTRPCILYDIKKCVAPCVGLCTPQEYDQLVSRAVRFLRGQDHEIVKELYQEMEALAARLEFERAAELLKTIRHLEKTVEGQNVDTPLGNDADAIGIYREGDEVVLSVLFFRSGRLKGARHFNFRSIAETDQELVSTFLIQNYDASKEVPHDILTPVDLEESDVLEELIAEGRPRKVEIFNPKRGDKCKLIEMAYLNAESAYKKEKDAGEIRARSLLEIQEKLHLLKYPKRIECYDISNISGSDTVAAMVAFVDGEKDAARYRKYKIRSADASDDYGAMREVLTRRLKKGEVENDLPDLIMIDGGKGHLNVALKVMKELNLITVDVVSIVKEEGRHDRGPTLERVFIPNVKDPVNLQRHSAELFLLQKIRDEAHRVAISFQRDRRSKTVVKSALEEVEGIGPAKRKNLLKFFGSLKRLKEATLEEIARAPGISKKDAEALKDYFSN